MSPRAVAAGRGLRARDASSAAQVVDASAILPAFFADEADEFSDACVASVEACETWVPPLWRLECANGVLVAHRRARISLEQRAWIAAGLGAMPVLIDDGRPSEGTLIDLAARHVLSVYDAAYLELAIRRSATLVTRDERLAAAARAAKHPVRWRRPRR